MKKLKLSSVFILLFVVSNQLFAQEKTIAYAGYVVGKSKTELKHEGKGILLGLIVETPTKRKNLFLDFGLELTYLEDSRALGDGLTCENCDRIAPPDGSLQRDMELAAPLLLKLRLLGKGFINLNVKSGYAPTLSFPMTSYYYQYLDITEGTVERIFYKNDLQYIHTYYLGLDFRFNIKENFGLELSPICKYQTFKNSFFKQKRFQYALATRVFFDF